jgi:methylphosphotriester-DNA--protein-cysteine methyltransferase
MKKTISVFLVIFLTFLAAVFAAGPDTVVYITKSGEKYHTENCSSLRNSKTAITLEEAVLQGYEPCQRCNPPILDEEE